MRDYEVTPSFFVNEEYFNKYLGQTSYYLKLQEITEKIIDFSGAETVLEFGTALGTSIARYANKFNNVDFTGVDIRKDMVKKASETFKNIKNLKFISFDMCEYVKKTLKGIDLIYLLYSFHHIKDPLEKKEEFLKDCYENMDEGAYLFIVESFIPDECQDEIGIKNWFETRALEGYASSYWNSLNSLDKNMLEVSKKIADFSYTEEYKAGMMVLKRDSEYLVKFEWLKQVCQNIGFKIVIAEPVNCICENAILLRR